MKTKLKNVKIDKIQHIDNVHRNKVKSFHSFKAMVKYVRTNILSE